MAQYSQPLGLLGGTFDPIHFGHLRVALEAIEQLDLQKVHFIPCKHPVHKAAANASKEHRLAMLKLAIENEPQFMIDEQELWRESPSYIFETLQANRQLHPNTPLVLILGSDSFANITTWNNWENIPDIAHLAVIKRPNYTIDETANVYQALHTRFTEDKTTLHNSLSGNIIFISGTQLDIASTHIRHLIRNNQNPRFLTPNSVLEYIQLNSLYKEKRS